MSDIIALAKRGAKLVGRHKIYIDGVLVGEHCNIVPKEGLIYLLNAGVRGQPQISTWYLAVFSGAVEPAATWTAANFSANASEITSDTEGYSNPTRPAWNYDTAPLSNSVLTFASHVDFNITCTTSITISGSAVLSSPVKGGSTGILLSALRYPTPYVVNNGTAFGVGYTVELQDL